VNIQIPTVFVALRLTDNQVDLFGEIEIEARDILGDRPCLRSNAEARIDDLILLDCEHVRMALGWSALETGDVLTLAVGARPDHPFPSEQARDAADFLRDLVSRAEALFEVEQSLWQIASVPLSADAIGDHAAQLSGVKKASPGAPFLTFEPDQKPRAEERSEDRSAGDFLTGIRDALNEANEEPSWAMQLSALALSSTFVLVTPPVGIAMFTYAALRQGTDMDLLPRNLDISKWLSQSDEGLRTS